jgi:hypothetical protein
MAVIYKITNIINGKSYIGKTKYINPNKRFREHLREYKKDRCKDRPLYRAFNKYGVDNFSFEILLETDTPEIDEVRLIEEYDTFKTGYNATLGGDGKSYVNEELIINTYKELQSIKETSKVCNYDSGTIRRILVSNNIQIKHIKNIQKEKYIKLIKMLDKNNNIINTFNTQYDAAEYLVANNYTKTKDLEDINMCLIRCARKQRKTAFGFIWEFE